MIINQFLIMNSLLILRIRNSNNIFLMFSTSKRLFKYMTALSLATGMSAAVYERINDSYVFTRNLRTIRCGLNILYSYKIAFNEQNYLDIHQNIAEDIYNTCIHNDGLYVKFGQGIAAMDHLLPPPFYKHLSKLQDKAKAATYEKISKLFYQEVGKPIQEVFTKFEKQPIASASLAQVHRATLKDGRQVAVKIQKPNIKKQFRSDMLMHYLINWVIQTAFDLPLLQFVDDIQHNLQKELDFTIQAQNTKTGRRKFQQIGRDDLYVAKIIDDYTRKRVLVMQWIDGFKITDNELIKKYKYNQKTLLEKTISAFAQQIFITGFVHCDPHPGNIFIRPNPQNPKNPQIVILDFGLCLNIQDKFRLQYAQFWKAMFLQQKQKMEEICKIWGLDRHVEIFAGSQLMRPYNSKRMVNAVIKKQDVLVSQARLKNQMKQLMKQTQNFPKQLLFINRNMNLVRSLNKFYGGKADRISIMAKAAYIGSSVKHSFRISKGLKYQTISFAFTFRLWILSIVNWFIELIFKKSTDQILNENIQQLSRNNFQKYGFKTQNPQAYNA